MSGEIYESRVKNFKLKDLFLFSNKKFNNKGKVKKFIIT